PEVQATATQSTSTWQSTPQPGATAVSYYPTVPTASVWNTYDPSLHYYYSQLDYKEKSAFSCRYDAIALGRADLWDISNLGLTGRQTKRVEIALNCDCPELMTAGFSEGLYAFYQTMSPGSSDWYQNEARQNARLLQSALSAINRIRQQSEWSSTDFSKELAYDRYVVKNCLYVLDNDGPKGSLHLDTDYRAAYSALVNATAVCEGYARSTALAMRVFGIPCIYVHGGTASGGYHAWNMIRIDGSWYQYDATWNDTNDESSYRDYLPYFNISDARMYRSRSLEPEFASYGFSMPVCASESANYYNKNGQYLSSSQVSRIPQLMKQAKSRGERAVGILFENESAYNAALKYINNGSAYPGFHYSYSANQKAMFIYFTW
ncbi:MAG: hypothetical protein J5998_01115, partial [Clostridia bacterium]|nr:hypothetical protein [Clostridia bacterium]